MTDKRSEASEQAEVVAYVRSSMPGVLFTSTGAGLGFHVRYQAAMNRGGYLKGTPDLIFMEPRGVYHGLFIEMKSRVGSVRPEQKALMEELNQRGYKACICFGAEQAIEQIKAYFIS